MTNPKMTMAELSRLATPGLTPVAAAASAMQAQPAASALTVDAVNQRLADQVGKEDLGFFANIFNDWAEAAAATSSRRELRGVRTTEVTKLMTEKIRGEIAILRAHFQADFSDRLASLAEMAVASQINMGLKLNALEINARDAVVRCLKLQCDSLQQMVAKDEIDPESFHDEVKHRFARCTHLKDTFARLVDDYKAVIENTYRAAKG